MQVDVLDSRFYCACDALLEKRARHEVSRPARVSPKCIRVPRALRLARTGLVLAITAGAKTATQVAGVRDFDIEALHFASSALFKSNDIFDAV